MFQTPLQQNRTKATQTKPRGTQADNFGLFKELHRGLGKQG
jgi:hypothetical protein